MDPNVQELIARLQANPTDAYAFERLHAFFTQLGDAESLANLTETWALHQQDPQVAAEAYMSAGEMARSRLGDQQRALGLFRRALQQQPLHPGANTQVERMLEFTGEHVPLVELLGQRAAALGDGSSNPEWLVATLIKMGEVLRKHLGSRARALECYQRALHVQPNSAPALAAARELLHAGQDYGGAADICERQARVATDSSQRVALFRELSELRHRLGDLDGSVAALRHAHETVPADADITVALARQLLARADGSPAVVAVADRAHAAALFFEMADGAPPPRAKAFVDQALDAQPDHDAALSLLEHLAGGRANPELVHRWLAFVRAAPDAPATPNRRRRVVRAYLQTHQLGDALATLEPLLVAGDPETIAWLASGGMPQDGQDTAPLDAGEWGRLMGGGCDVLLGAGHADLAIPLLWQRVDQADRPTRVALLRDLAELFEKRLDDLDAAFKACARLLEEKPGDTDALDRMERIDEQGECWDRLLDTLSYRVDMVEGDERAPVLLRMAQIADTRLGEHDRAVGHYRQVLDTPAYEHEAVSKLTELLGRTGQVRDLVVLLQERADQAPDDQRRLPLLRHVARIVAASVRNPEAAKEAWTRVLAVADDREALEFLCAHAREQDTPQELVEALARLAGMTANADSCRDLLFERASVLAGQLDRPEDAIVDLRLVVDELDAGSTRAFEELAGLYEKADDSVRLAETLERWLAVSGEGSAPVARRLADLCEGNPELDERAERALRTWCECDVVDSEPLRRLRAVLERGERWEEQVACLDRLAALEEGEEVGEFTRSAAAIACRRLHDAKGAFDRLGGAVAAGDVESESLLRELAEECGAGTRLAELFVQLAQSEGAGDTACERWVDAARAYETLADKADKALEAMLRAFAMDLTHDGRLGDVERLAIATGAWPRLEQVYDRLVREAPDQGRKVELLTRYAGVLEEAGETSSAFDAVLRACGLAPMSEDLLARAEALAPTVDRTDELLVLHERRRAAAPDAATAVRELLRAADICATDLGDEVRARDYLDQAVRVAAGDPAALDDVEEAARVMDEARDTGEDSPTLARLAAALGREAARASGEAGQAYALRAARLGAATDPNAALSQLDEAVARAPESHALWDAYEELARKHSKLEQLEKRLGELADDAVHRPTTIALLGRRGRLLQVDLARSSDAADVFRQLTGMGEYDPEVHARHRACLRADNRHEDLLIAIDRELVRVDDAERRIGLLAEAARTWEHDIGNRWEALDAWRSVVDADADYVEAREAVARLERAPTGDGRRDEPVLRSRDRGGDETQAPDARKSGDPDSPEGDEPGDEPVPASADDATPSEDSGTAAVDGPGAVPPEGPNAAVAAVAAVARSAGESTAEVEIDELEAVTDSVAARVQADADATSELDALDLEPAEEDWWSDQALEQDGSLFEEADESFDAELRAPKPQA